MSSTICALATPPGAGGIAVVRVSGPEAYAVVGEIFTPRNPAKRVAEAKGYTAMLGHYHLRGEEMDETIALFFRAPHSYTGEDVIELSVHGGNAMAQGLLEALYLAGAAPAGPGEFTRRALENGRMSLTQAEAVMEIISAEGRQGAALAKSALDGALARRIAGIQAALQTLAAHLTAWIDYPEEDVPEVSQAELIAEMALLNVEQERRLYQVEEQVETVVEAVENIKRGNMRAGYVGYRQVVAKSGMTDAKCRNLVNAYRIPTDTHEFMTPDGLLSRRAIVEFEPFMKAFRQMMAEAEPRGTRWYHPKMGLFQAIGWEDKA